MSKILQHFLTEGHLYHQYLKSPLLHRIRSYEFKCIQKILAQQSYGQALELGCGSGFYTELLAKHSAQVTAVDFSPSMLGHIQHPHIKTICANIESLDLSEKFDFAFSFGLTEFLEEPAGFLRVVERHLKTTGGRALIAFPIKNLWSLPYRLHYQRKGISIHLYNLKELRSLLKGTSLKIESERFVFPMNQVFVLNHEALSLKRQDAPAL